MEVKQFKLTTSDGLETIGNVWKRDTKELKGNVVISHGMCEYSMRYDAFAKFLNSKGYDVYALDQVGHGLNNRSGLGAWDDYSFKQCVKNLHTEMVSLRITGKPTILIGHSMGSFICQYYLQKYSRELHINGVVLIGTSGPRFIYKVGATVASIHAKFHRWYKPSKLMTALSFGSFNKKIKHKKTKYDWVCANEEIVNKYVNDPLCMFTPSVGFYASFYKSLQIMFKKKRLSWINKELPILILGGKEDPVANYGKGLHSLQKTYAKHGVSSEVKIYDGMRHEILNEVNNRIVYEDILEFIDKNIQVERNF